MSFLIKGAVVCPNWCFLMFLKNKSTKMKYDKGHIWKDKNVNGFTKEGTVRNLTKISVEVCHDS